jgi:hypothetical protein
MFQEHRSPELAAVRHYIAHVMPSDLDGKDLTQGLEALPEAMREPVRRLAWFYDNLGALVTHGVVDVAPVSGYLGPSVVDAMRRVQAA